MPRQTFYIDILTFKPEPCEWGAWNQYLIFSLKSEEPLNGDQVRVIGPALTLGDFLLAEGYDHLVGKIKALPA